MLRADSMDAWMGSTLCNMAKATQHFRGESSDHLEMREGVPQRLLQICTFGVNFASGLT